MATAALPETLTPPALDAVSECERQVKSMEQALDRRKPMFLEIEAVIAPYSSNIEQNGTAYQRNADDVLNTSIFFARTTLGSFLASAMTNPSRIWSQGKFRNQRLADRQDAKQWLHEFNERRFDLLAGSNFYETMAEVYEEWPSYSTSVVLVEEDEEDGLRYVRYPIGSYALADDARGKCCAVSRRFQMTVRQLVLKFALRSDGTIDLTKLSRSTAQLVRDKAWDKPVEVAHLVCANGAFDPRKRTRDAFKWASLYWEWGADASQTGASPERQFLAQDGYREWPFMVFRWGRVSGDPFGVNGPGQMTLADVKSIQQMEADRLMVTELLARPPLGVPTGANSISILPSAVNKFDTRTGQHVGPLHVAEAQGLVALNETMALIDERIFGHWFTNLVLALNADPQGTKTAREVEEISQEKFLVLGRVVEKAKEAFDTAFAREFAIMARRGFLPEPIADLAGESITLQYTSFLAIAQGQIGLQRIENFGLMMAQMAKLTEDPAFRLKVDYAQYIDEVANLAGVPPRVIRSDEDVEQMQAAAAAAQEEARRAEVDAMRAKTVKDLGTTPATGDTALSALSQVAGPGGIPSSASGLVS